MAKKKRKPAGRGRPSPRGSGRIPEDLPVPPDQRLMEGRMWQFLGGPAGTTDPASPRARAQDLLYQAYETADSRRRVALARQALETWPDCADAYVLLAEHAPNRQEARALYEQGVAAGQRALGEEVFRHQAGHFWGILETRPYMRARLGLAESLWTTGHREEAIRHLQEMLRLNPNDNQGLRYILAAWLLSQDRDEDLARLLQQYNGEMSAAWAYTQALVAFRRQGDTPEARRLLKAARKANKHVPAYLLDRKPLPPERPPCYSMGDANEAILYAGDFLGGWKATPGAMAWLRERAGGAKEKRARTPPPQGPLPLAKEQLQRLPQRLDVWQADFRRLPIWINAGSERRRPWMVLIASRSEDLVLAQDVLEEEPTSDHLWDSVAAAVQRPLAGAAHRPTELQVGPDERWQALAADLEELGIRCVREAELDHLDLLFADLVKHLAGGPEPPGLLDVPRVGPGQGRSFYEAAAEFYRRAPWRALGYEATCKVECAKYQGGPWYAVVMGQSGMVFGLALYEDLHLLRQLQRGHLSDEENARLTVSLTVLFGEASEMRIADLEAAERYGWPVAGPQAYPSAFRKERGRSLRPPLAWELELMEACLRALPDFIARRLPDDRTREEVTVPVAGGALPLALAWVDEAAG